MKTKRELYTAGVAALVASIGGQQAFVEQINNGYQRGEITRKQASDLRKAVDEACSIKHGFVVESETARELDKKITEAAAFYR